MRVLQINSGNLFGGIESLQLTLAQYSRLCPELDFEFGFCFEGKASAELAAQRATVHHLGAVHVRYPWSVVRARSVLDRILAERAFDAVVFHGPWSFAIFGPVARRRNVPAVLWLHDPAARRLDWLHWWARRTEAGLVICNSQYTAAGAHRVCPGAKRRTVVYCPVAPPPRRRSDAERLAMRAELDTPADACVILQISRLDPHKGYAIHLEALGRLLHVPGWTCWFVAGAQRPHEVRYFDELKQTAERLGIARRVRFLGFQPDPWRLYHSADIYCQPNSAPEPFGITYVEALWAGLPVVATALGGALEIVRPECGLLTPPGDVAAVAAALERLIANPAERAALGAEAPARAREISDPAARIGDLQAVLASLTGAVSHAVA